MEGRDTVRGQVLYAFESPLTGGWWDRIRGCAWNRRAVVDDVRRDKDEEITLFVVGARFAEQPADDRQVDEERNSRLGLRGLRYGKTADYRGLAVADEELGVARLLAEDEAHVRRSELRIGILGVQQQEDLPVVGDVRGDRQDDTDLLHLYSRARLLVRVRPAVQIGGTSVEHSDRNFLTDLNRSLSVVERHDARLGLKVGETDFLERVEETRELEFAEGRREHDAERRVDDPGVCVRDRGQRVAAEQNPVALERRAAAEGVGYSVAVGVDRLERRWIRTLDQLAEELIGARTKIVRKSDVFDIGSVDEDDLGLDADLRSANVEVAHILQDVGEARGRLRDDECVGGAIGGDEAACDAVRPRVADDIWAAGDLRAVLLQQRLNGRYERRRASIVDRDKLCLERLGRLAIKNIRVAVHGDDSGDQIFGCGQALSLKNRAQRDIPWLVFDFGRDSSLHVLPDDDGPARERRERRYYIADIGVLERDGDGRLLGLLDRREERDRLDIVSRGDFRGNRTSNGRSRIVLCIDLRD